MLTISCNLLNIVQRGKTRMAAGVQNACGHSGCWPWERRADRELWLTAVPGTTGDYRTVVYCYPRKGQNSDFKLWFLLTVYCFYTAVKSKHLKSNHVRNHVYVKSEGLQHFHSFTSELRYTCLKNGIQVQHNRIKKVSFPPK